MSLDRADHGSMMGLVIFRDWREGGKNGQGKNGLSKNLETEGRELLQGYFISPSVFLVVRGGATATKKSTTDPCSTKLSSWSACQMGERET